MSDNSISPAGQSSQASSVTPETANTASTAAPTQSNASSTFGSIGALQAKEPKLWEQMMNGMAMKICNEMKDHQSRIKEMMAKAREDTKA